MIAPLILFATVLVANTANDTGDAPCACVIPYTADADGGRSLACVHSGPQPQGCECEKGKKGKNETCAPSRDPAGDDYTARRHSRGH